ncbi:DUF4149 domain-containing protein [Candidatus Marinimicrobia bacterium]|nr:DUF4149 domain-containing protein [Candidatus Neomarinimicrobiota bacterium]
MALDLTYLKSFFSGFISAVIIYQSVIVAATAFKSLERKQSSIFLRTIFPRFFKLIFVLGALTFVLCLISRTSIYEYLVSLTTIVLSILCVSIIPLTNRYKDNNNEKMFGYLHTLSVLLTMIILFVNISLIFLIYY